MPTAVLDFDLQHLPCEINGLDGYDRALILVRWRGQPINKVTLPVSDSRLDPVRLHAAIANLLSERDLRNRCVRDFLDWDELPALSLKPSLTSTIAICTRDRTEELRRCLEALLSLPDDRQEIIVVDNCPSTIDTFNLVKANRRIRYIHEDRLGLNIARNRALRDAAGEIVVFCDDDAVPERDWLRAHLRNFDDPLVMCVTGLTMPLELETEAQEIFERYSPFGRGFRRRIYDNSTLSPWEAGRAGAGANMSLRRSALEQIGEFDEALDAGTPTCSGGDTEYFARILNLGFRIVYEPAALSWHRHQRTLEELRQTYYGYGVGTYASWTRSLLRDGELSVMKGPWAW
ncbi:MAG: glycosyltransferase, partial [Blastocatellia bacterium]|nr:glycosyltransferase [Blastocatellia bacterium]